MKRLLKILIGLAAVLIGIGVYQSFIPQRSWLISAGMYVAENEQETQEFQNKLKLWLKANDFSRVDDPGGTHSWAGIHSSGETNEWYRGKINGSEDFLIRASKLQRLEVRKGWTEFEFNHSWHIRGSQDKIDRAKSQSSEIAQNFLAWIEESKKPNKPDMATPNQPSD